MCLFPTNTTLLKRGCARCTPEDRPPKNATSNSSTVRFPLLLCSLLFIYAESNPGKNIYFHFLFFFKSTPQSSDLDLGFSSVALESS